MKRVAIVTGGSSGIGKAAAQVLADRGCIVYEFSRRNPETSVSMEGGMSPENSNNIEGIHHIHADVTKEAEVRRAVHQVVKEQKRIDILVNNAGFGISGALEMTESRDAHAQLEVNLFGMDNVTRAVLPVMRKQRRGRIVCVSSIAGIIPIPFQTWYSVSKAAILAYVLGLQNEVKPWHITVCAILPGDIATGFTAAREKSMKGNDIYGGRIAKSVAGMEHDEIHGMAPETVGRAIAKYAMKKNSRPFIAVGFLYQGAALLGKLLPRQLSNWIVGLLYGGR